MVALVSEHFGETLVSQNPIVHAVRHRGDRIKEIAVPGLEPDADRLRRTVGDQRRAEMRIGLCNFAALDAEIGDRRSRPRAVVLPSAARQSRIMRPLLVHHCRRISQDPVVKFRMEPGHREGRRAARADAHRRAAFGILCELDVCVFFGQRQHFVLDELGIGSVDRVIFEPALAPLSVLPARADADCDDRGDAMLPDEIVKNGKELLFIGVARVAEDNERSFAPRYVTRRNIDVDRPRPDPGMSRWNKKVRLVAGRCLPRVDRLIEAAVGIIPDHAGIEDGAIVRRHGEGIDLARGRSVLSRHLRRRRMCRPDDEVAFRLARGERSVGQFGRRRIVGILWVARRRQRFEIEA